MNFIKRSRWQTLNILKISLNKKTVSRRFFFMDKIDRFFEFDKP